MWRRVAACAVNAPWWQQVSDLDKEKAGIYRDAALSHGIPDRPNGLYPVDDPLLTELRKSKTIFPFEKQ